jgi:hypothetical protein
LSQKKRTNLVRELGSQKDFVFILTVSRKGYGFFFVKDTDIVKTHTTVMKSRASIAALGGGLNDGGYACNSGSAETRIFSAGYGRTPASQVIRGHLPAFMRPRVPGIKLPLPREASAGPHKHMSFCALLQGLLPTVKTLPSPAGVL